MEEEKSEITERSFNSEIFSKHIKQDKIEMDRLHKIINNLREDILNLREENLKKDKKIIFLESEIKILNDQLKFQKCQHIENQSINKIKNNENKVKSNPIRKENAQPNLILPNLDMSAISEDPIATIPNDKDYDTGSFSYKFKNEFSDISNNCTITNQLDTISVVSNTSIISETPSKYINNRLNKTDFSISRNGNSNNTSYSNIGKSTFIKLNELEIDELYDNEMENFLDKLKNTKVEEDKNFVSILNAIDTQYTQQNTLNTNESNKKLQKPMISPQKKKLPHKFGNKENKYLRQDLKKISKGNEEKLRSISTKEKSKVKDKEYISKVKISNKYAEICKLKNLNNKHDLKGGGLDPQDFMDKPEIKENKQFSQKNNIFMDLKSNILISLQNKSKNSNNLNKSTISNNLDKSNFSINQEKFDEKENSKIFKPKIKETIKDSLDPDLKNENLNILKKKKNFGNHNNPQKLNKMSIGSSIASGVTYKKKGIDN
jgi:hypothetical protein